MIDLWLAIAHHLTIFALVAILAMQFALIRPGLTADEVVRLRRIDSLYGSLAILILFVGIMRVTYGVRGQEYYMQNPMFWMKMTAFAAVALLSVPPTFRIYNWWQASRRDAVYSPPFDEITRVRGFLKAEAAVFVLIPIFAAAAARGTGFSTPGSPYPMSTTQTLVLDLDGTLVDTAGDLVETLNVILRGEGLRPLAFEAARGLVGHGARAMLEAGLGVSGVAPRAQQVELLFETFVTYYSEHIADQSRPYPGAEAALDRFTAAGWRLAICTNKLEALARQLLGTLGLADRFAVIAGQDTFGARKPDPRHLTDTILRAGGSKDAAILVGDFEVDIATARAASIPIIGVTFGYSPISIAELAPDIAIDHFDQLYDAATRILSERQRQNSL